MDSTWYFKPLVVLLHILTLFLGFFSIELILFLRNQNENTNFLSGLSTTSIFHSVREAIAASFAPYILSSWRRFGTLIFGLTCFCSIGFVTLLSIFFYVSVPEYKNFLEFFWKFDALFCSVLLFFVIPLGLSHKYIKLRSNLELKQKVLSTLGFVAFWIAFGSLFGYIILHDMFQFMKNRHVGFLFTSVYYMCGFGLFFVAVLVGFSGIYLPYLLYVINRDVSSVRQLESLISDCHKARRDLKLRMLDNNFDLSEDSADEEFYFNLDSGTPSRSDESLHLNKSPSSKDDQLLTSYRPAEMCMNFETDHLGNVSVVPSKFQSFFKKIRAAKLRVSSTLFRMRYAKNFSHSSGGQQEFSEMNFNMWMMMNDLKNDLDYLRMLKREKESSAKLTGKIYLFVKCIVAGGCMINCFKICKRGIMMLSSNYGKTMSRLDNQKIITKVYYEFLRDEIVSSILNEVLENVQLPTTFDFIISRANSIFLACVMISSVGYFLDFGRVLLKTKYLQKNKLMSDSSLGLALACFMILTFPSQFILVIPFLPRDLKLSILKFLFQNDIYVWFGLRYRFDLIVMFTILVTFVGVLIVHYSRSFSKVNLHVGCNV